MRTSKKNLKKEIIEVSDDKWDDDWKNFHMSWGLTYDQLE